MFTFWAVKGLHKFHISTPQKGLPWPERTTCNDVLCAGCVQRCDLWSRWSSKEKRKKFSCVKLAICPYHQRWHSPL